MPLIKLISATETTAAGNWQTEMLAILKKSLRSITRQQIDKSQVDVNKKELKTIKDAFKAAGYKSWKDNFTTEIYYPSPNKAREFGLRFDVTEDSEVNDTAEEYTISWMRDGMTDPRA